jgi:hypothetical protein
MEHDQAPPGGEACPGRSNARQPRLRVNATPLAVVDRV